jgi:hypothetical protein
VFSPFHWARRISTLPMSISGLLDATRACVPPRTVRASVASRKRWGFVAQSPATGKAIDRPVSTFAGTCNQSATQSGHSLRARQTPVFRAVLVGKAILFQLIPAIL